eukprot:PhM_4_TR9060/c0_g1_i1/m.5352
MFQTRRSNMFSSSAGNNNNNNNNYNPTTSGQSFISTAVMVDLGRRFVFVILCLVLIVHNVTTEDRTSVPFWHTVLEAFLTFVLCVDVASRWSRERGEFWQSHMNILEVLIAGYCVVSLLVSTWIVRDMDDAALTVRFLLQLCQAISYVRPAQSVPPIASVIISAFRDPAAQQQCNSMTISQTNQVVNSAMLARGGDRSPAGLSATTSPQPNSPCGGGGIGGGGGGGGG